MEGERGCAKRQHPSWGAEGVAGMLSALKDIKTRKTRQKERGLKDEIEEGGGQYGRLSWVLSLKCMVLPSFSRIQVHRSWVQKIEEAG